MPDEQQQPPQPSYQPPSQSPSSSPYLIPGSILVAGVLVAVSILYTGSSNYPSDEIVEQPTINLSDAAEEIGLNREAFDECVNSGKYATAVQGAVQKAIDAGGNGTPYSVLIGPKGEKVVVSGAQPIASVKAAIDGLLAGKPITTPKDPALDKVEPVSDKDHLLGNPSAPVKIVEYSDLDCPFCKTFHATLQQIMEDYGKQGKVAWVYRHFPLAQLHPDAPRKAEATECATELGGQQAFWALTDQIMSAGI